MVFSEKEEVNVEYFSEVTKERLILNYDLQLLASHQPPPPPSILAPPPLATVAACVWMSHCRRHDVMIMTNPQ